MKISKPDKVLFARVGITKADLAGYYERISKVMLPHVGGRPISMQRFPDGVEAHGFYHKDAPAHFPDWIERVTVPKRGGSVTHVVISNADTLVYLANQACITPHIWLSRKDELGRPDRLVFDLDPSDGDFSRVRRAAIDLGELLEQLGLAPFAMTTGSRGLHVWVPLRRGPDFEAVRSFARDVAEVMVDRHPDELTLEARKAKRGNRILIDVLRNGYAQTAVPPYAVRPRPTAPVATPLRWSELSDSRLRPDKFTVANVERRVARLSDPWKGISRHARSLTAPQKKLGRL